MERLTEAILQKVNALPEGAPISAKMLLHLGTRPAIDQSLSRLARRGKLLRAGRGVYVAPVKSRFGIHAPSAQRLVEELSTQRGETIVPSGATSANALGLTTQVPTRTVYLTSGRSRKLMLGRQVVHLQHVPSWQLMLAKEPAGEIVRALAWAGPERAQKVLRELEGKVPRSELQKINRHISLFPGWMANALSESAISIGERFSSKRTRLCTARLAQISGHLASVNRADNMGRDGGAMKTTDEKAEIPVSAEVEEAIRQRLESLDEDKKSAVDARQAVSEIRRNLKTPQPH